LDQPNVTGPVLFAYVNKRSSALNASLVVVSTPTAALVQSISYSRAVLFHGAPFVKILYLTD